MGFMAVAAPIVGQAAGKVGGSLLDRAGQELGDKIFGVPKPPSQPSGSWLGQEAKDYMDKVYPGTTVFERLGVQSPVGQVSSAGLSSGIQASSGQRIANREMFQQSMMQKAQLALEKYKVDTDAMLRSRDLDLREAEQPSKIQQQEYGSVTSAAKSIGDKAVPLLKELSGTPSTLMGLFKAAREANYQKSNRNRILENQRKLKSHQFRSNSNYSTNRERPRKDGRSIKVY